MKFINQLSPATILLLATYLGMALGSQGQGGQGGQGGQPQQQGGQPQTEKVYGKNGWVKVTVDATKTPLQLFFTTDQYCIRGSVTKDATLSPSFFTGNQIQSNNLIGWMGDAPSGQEIGKMNVNTFKTVMEQLDVKHWGAMSSDAAEVMGPYAHLVGDMKKYGPKYGAMTPGSFATMARRLNDDHKLRLIHQLDAKAQAHFATGILGALGDQVHRVNNKLMAILLADKQVCSQLYEGHLNNFTKDQLKMISADCASRIPGRSISETVMPKLNTTFFHLTMQDSYSDNALRRMTADQARTYNSEINDGTECSKLNVFQLNTEAFKAVPLPCLKNALPFALTDGRTTGEELKKLIKHVPKEFFMAATADELAMAIKLIEGLGKEAEIALKGITTEQLNAILANHEACEHVPFALLARHRDAKISALCFGSMSHEQQSAVLSNFDSLPDDIFSLLEKPKVQAWSVSRGRHQNLTGWHVINAMAHLDNIADIIQHIDAVYGEHPGSLITELDVLRDIPALLHHLTGTFLDATGIVITEEQFKEHKLPERLRYILPISQLGHLDWAKVDRDQVGHLISGYSFCRQAPQDIWNKIDKKHLDQMTPRCAKGLRQKDKISQSLVKVFPNSAFRQYTARQVTVEKFDVKSITDSQLSQLSADVTDPAQQVSVTFTQSTLDAMNAERLGHLSAATLAACPAAAFKSFNTKERVQALHEMSLVKLDLERVKAIPNLHDMTPFQIAHLDQSTLAAFTPEVQKKMSKASRFALMRRLGKSAAGKSMVTLGAAGVAAIALVAAMFV